MCLRMSESLQVEMIPIGKSLQVYAGKNRPCGGSGCECSRAEEGLTDLDMSQSFTLQLYSINYHNHKNV